MSENTSDDKQPTPKTTIRKRIAKEPPKETPDTSEAKELKEQLLRLTADFENFKKRTETERGRLVSVAQTDLILELLPVIDNFDRAFKDVPKEIASTDWYQGIAAIKKQFENILEQLGVSRIAAVGEPFDPEHHEAVSHEPSDEHDKDIVAEEFEAGYQLGETVIRPAKVKVSSGKQ